MATKTAKTGLTRAQKTTATKALVKELLAINPMRHNELIDEVAKLYMQRHESADTENPNDVKGRVGSVLDIMKKESEIMYDGGIYVLKARMPMPVPEEKVEETTEKKSVEAPKKKGRAKKAEPVSEPVKEAAKEAAAPKKRGRVKKAEPVSVTEEKAEPVAPVSIEEKIEKKSAPKKRGRKPKAVEEKVEEKPIPFEKKAEVAPPAEEKAEVAPVVAPIQEKAVEEPIVKEIAASPIEEKTEMPVEVKLVEEKKAETEKKELIVAPKGEVVQKNVVMDMSFLFGDKAKKAVQKPAQAERREEGKAEEKKIPMSEVKADMPVKKEEKKPVPVKTDNKPTKAAPLPAPVPAPVMPVKAEGKAPARKVLQREPRKVVEKPMTADEKLKDSFLKRMRTLGGDYFEYYSVYLLERYSMKNGRRLEGLRISGGDHDGGIDGEIELTDRMGFKETIYIQSKNWDPEKGKEENWVVGETLLQQFIGACACRQAKEGKQHTRGIFVTTSRFTPDAKKILDDMSDKIVGYDGNDLYEAAKECSFGIIKKNGEWVLDENLLSGTKAFFQMM